MRKRYKLSISLIVFFVLFLFVEVYLRSVLPNMINLGNIITIHENGSDYELKPNSSIMFDGFQNKIPATKVEISQQGFRDRIYLLDKSPGVKRVAVLGDSFVFGWGVNVDKSIPKQLETMFMEDVCRNNDLQYLKYYKIIDINDESIYVSAKNDRHYNAKGCEIISREIYNFIKKEML